MGDIDLPAATPLLAAERQQAAIRQVVQCPLEQEGVVGGGLQFRDRLLAAGVGPSLAELDQPQEDPPGDRLLLRRREGSQRRLGAAGHGDLQARAFAARGPGRAGGRSQRLIRPQRQESPLQSLPQEHEGFLDQGEDPRLPGRVGHQTLDEGLLDKHPDGLGRANDRLA